MAKKSFNELLSAQVGNEFVASQQYVAVAVCFGGQDLPQLAAHFYRQSLEERNHAMMMVQYMLDRNQPVEIRRAIHVVVPEGAGRRSGLDVYFAEYRGARGQPLRHRELCRPGASRRRRNLWGGKDSRWPDPRRSSASFSSGSTMNFCSSTDLLGAYLGTRVLRCRCGFQMEKQL